MKTIPLFLLLVVLSGQSPSLAADLVPVGVARVDISPERAVPLINELTPELSRGITQPLFARAFAIGEDPPVVLVGFDGIGVPGPLSEEVATRLAERAIPRKNVALTASHTHWAPHLSGFLPGIFGAPFPPEHREEIERYTDFLIQRLCDVAIEAVDSREPMRLSRAIGRVEFAANRRLAGSGELVIDEEAGIMITNNPEAPVDHSMPTWFAEAADGTVRGILFTYACHNVAITGRSFSGFRNRVHGDWVGLAQEEIENRHPNAVALGTIGCGGDQRPITCGGIETARTHAREIAREVDRLFTTPGTRESVSGSLHTTRQEVALPLAPPPSRETLETFVNDPKSRSAMARAMVARRILSGDDKRDSVPFQIQRWRFEKGPSLLFLSGEVCIDYQLWLKSEFGDSVQPIAYTNSIPCYIVSKRMLEQGGYEAGNSMYYYGYLSPLLPETEDIIHEAVRETLAE